MKEPRIWWHAQNLAAEAVTDRLDDAVRDAIDEHLSFEDGGTRYRLLRALEDATHRTIRRAIPWWREGRAWLHLPGPPWRKRGSTILGVSWHRGGWHCGMHLDIGGGLADDDFSVGIRLPLVGSLWLSVEGLLPWNWRPRDDHEIGFSIHDGAIWWKLLCNSHEWHSKAPFWDSRSRWRMPVWHVVDWLLGERHSTKRLIGVVRTELAMPEGAYPLTLTFEEWTWRRSRWPKADVIRRVHAELGVPLPIPGKGENSWDCGDDAIYSSTFCATIVEEALAHLAQSTLRTRQRYGGRDWAPQAAG